MKKIISTLLIYILLLIILFSYSGLAWGGETHAYLCPEEYQIDCNIADSHEFQRDNPYANNWYHVCYDNTEDCMPRLAAKYFLKKYYVGGKGDLNLLGAAAHLFQDASCPQHWYPGFLILGKETYPFAPEWAKTIEGDVNFKQRQGEVFNFPIRFEGKEINIDLVYLDNLKKKTSLFLSQEPEESLETIESQLKSKTVWQRLREYQSFIIILFIIFIPILGFGIWRYKRKKAITVDLVIILAALLVLMAIFTFIKIFY